MAVWRQLMPAEMPSTDSDVSAIPAPQRGLYYRR